MTRFTYLCIYIIQPVAMKTSWLREKSKSIRYGLNQASNHMFYQGRP